MPDPTNPASYNVSNSGNASNSNNVNVHQFSIFGDNTVQIATELVRGRGLAPTSRNLHAAIMGLAGDPSLASETPTGRAVMQQQRPVSPPLYMGLEEAAEAASTQDLSEIYKRRAMERAAQGGPMPGMPPQTPTASQSGSGASSLPIDEIAGDVPDGQTLQLVLNALSVVGPPVLGYALWKEWKRQNPQGTVGDFASQAVNQPQEVRQRLLAAPEVAGLLTGPQQGLQTTTPPSRGGPGVVVPPETIEGELLDPEARAAQQQGPGLGVDPIEGSVERQALSGPQRALAGPGDTSGRSPSSRPQLPSSPSQRRVGLPSPPSPTPEGPPESRPINPLDESSRRGPNRRGSTQQHIEDTLVASDPTLESRPSGFEHKAQVTKTDRAGRPSEIAGRPVTARAVDPTTRVEMFRIGDVAGDTGWYLSDGTRIRPKIVGGEGNKMPDFDYIHQMDQATSRMLHHAARIGL